MLKLIYMTLPSVEVADAISMDLINQRLAACTNAFPIHSTYRWQGEVRREPEVVLIVKTKPGNFDAVKAVVNQHIDYINCVTELATDQTNQGFLDWLHDEVVAS